MLPAANSIVFRPERPTKAGCLVHVRCRFDELTKANAGPVAAQALERIANISRVGSQVRGMTHEARLGHRQQHSEPLRHELHIRMNPERTRVPDGRDITAALDYSLKRSSALRHIRKDGAVSLANNHIDTLMRPWALGRKASLFTRSELAGKRAAMVTRLVQSVELHGHDPWVYLKDVLERTLANRTPHRRNASTPVVSS